MNLISELCKSSHMTDVESAQSLSGPELLIKAQRRSENFKEQGLQKGQRVFIEHGNSIAFFIDLFAIWLAEACAVPIDPANPDIEIQKLINHCKASFRISAPEENLIPTEFAKLQSTKAYANLILYTSGTSGTPKGVVHSLETVEQRLSALKLNLPNLDFKKSLCILPTHFGHGLIGNCLFPMYTGGHLFIAKVFNVLSAYNFASHINTHNITFVSSVPSVWNLLELTQKSELNSLLRIHCASASFNPNLIQKIRSWSSTADIYNVYGTTETASWISGCKITEAEDAGFVGPGWGMKFEVTSPDSDGIGSVSVTGPGIAHEYWGLEDLTEARFKKISNKDKEFDTGDLGIIVNSNLKLKGRSDDLINKGGLKVNPSEVESVLIMNDHIASACVFSLEHSITQQTVAAAVCFKQNKELSTPELENWCQTHMPAYRIPSH